MLLTTALVHYASKKPTLCGVLLAISCLGYGFLNAALESTQCLRYVYYICPYCHDPSSGVSMLTPKKFSRAGMVKTYPFGTSHCCS